MLAIFEDLGIIFFAVTGAMEAHRRGMDLVGMYVIAFITALGGGTLRDFILNRYPLFWIATPAYAAGILAVSLIVALVLKFRHLVMSERAIIIPDALGLGLFSAVGVAYALQSGVSPFIAVLMGVITATFGGVLRDIICNEVPMIFKRGQLYATCSFGSAIVYALIKVSTNDHITATTACVATAGVLRFIAVRYDITLPL